MDKLIFILGVGRSGTTLIQSMLNAHPDIACPPETHFIRNYVGPQLRGKFPKLASKDALISKLNADEKIPRIGLDMKECVDAAVDLKNATYNKALFLEIMNRYLADKGKKHLGEKDPRQVSYLPEIKKSFPDSYIVHIIRDPREVILSRLKSEWGNEMSLFRHVVEYRYNMQEALALGRKLFGDRYIELYYEDLVESPEKVLKKVCEQLGLAFDPAMLEYHKQSDQIVSQDEMKWKGNVMKPVMKNNTRKWEKELKPSQIKLIEGISGHLMKQLGYETHEKVNFIYKNAVSIPAQLVIAAHKIKLSITG